MHVCVCVCVNWRASKCTVFSICCYWLLLANFALLLAAKVVPALFCILSKSYGFGRQMSVISSRLSAFNSGTAYVRTHTHARTRSDSGVKESKRLLSPLSPNGSCVAQGLACVRVCASDLSIRQAFAHMFVLYNCMRLGSNSLYQHCKSSNAAKQLTGFFSSYFCFIFI